ncbi:hypothetical protein [Kitasatospora sp. CB01950]|uniref:hypothetical protein n=1 Tax=Kitasatospora sp. CB01950 TaxID=1703930 RepID=UPI00093E3BF9|nr:hypothetical protein [Kitasatospora sp. CB01950]OKJ15805.1 hypothetical protein AMK19_06045 [Kitasatospora sp. CB01950]
MRRRLIGVGLLAVAGVLAISVPAQAATGLLVVNGVPHQDPARGCYNATSPITVQNFTNSVVLLHAAANCQGPVTAEVNPGRIATAVGSSYFVF